MSHILLVEDSKKTVGVLATVLKTEGYKVSTAANVTEALAQVASEKCSLVIADAGSVDGSARDFVTNIRSSLPTTAVIMIVDKDEDTEALAAVDTYACIRKPLRIDDLLGRVQGAVDYSEKAVAEMRDLSAGIETSYLFDDIVAESPAMYSACEMMKKVSATDVPVLLVGEDGVGKSLIARTIHSYGKRKDMKFLRVECRGKEAGEIAHELFGAGNEAGVLENADGGTVYLERVDALAPAIQDQLVAALRDRRVARLGGEERTAVDLRMLASMSPAGASGSEGGLSDGLRRHVGAIVISVPPLRERPEDIRSLTSRFVRAATKGASALQVAPEALSILESFDWPGNVTELDRTIAQAVQACEADLLTPDSLPDHLKNA